MLGVSVVTPEFERLGSFSSHPLSLQSFNKGVSVKVIGVLGTSSQEGRSGRGQPGGWEAIWSGVMHVSVG